jgi:hypothetical protein
VIFALNIFREGAAADRGTQGPVGDIARPADVVTFLLELLDARARVGVVPEPDQHTVMQGVEFHMGDRPSFAVGHQKISDVRFGAAGGNVVELDD